MSRPRALARTRLGRNLRDRAPGRRVEEMNRAELEGIRAQIEHGVPVDELKSSAPPPRFIHILRPVGAIHAGRLGSRRRSQT